MRSLVRQERKRTTVEREPRHVEGAAMERLLLVGAVVKKKKKKERTMTMMSVVVGAVSHIGTRRCLLGVAQRKLVASVVGKVLLVGDYLLSVVGVRKSLYYDYSFSCDNAVNLLYFIIKLSWTFNLLCKTNFA